MVELPRKIIFVSEDADTHEEIQRVVTLHRDAVVTAEIELIPQNGRERIAVVIEQPSSIAQELQAYRKGFMW